MGFRERRRGFGLRLAVLVAVSALLAAAGVAVLVAAGYGGGATYVYGSVRLAEPVNASVVDPFGNPILACDGVYVYVVSYGNGSAQVIAYSWLLDAKGILAAVEKCLGPWTMFEAINEDRARSIIMGARGVHVLVAEHTTMGECVVNITAGGKTVDRAGETRAPATVTPLAATVPIPRPTPAPVTAAGERIVATVTKTATVTVTAETTAATPVGEEFSGEKAIVVLLAGAAGATLAYMLWRTRLWRSVTP